MDTQYFPSKIGVNFPDSGTFMKLEQGHQMFPSISSIFAQIGMNFPTSFLVLKDVARFEP